jgi:hypothetical protein
LESCRSTTFSNQGRQRIEGRFIGIGGQVNEGRQKTVVPEDPDTADRLYRLPREELVLCDAGVVSEGMR